tara:strand:+ start:2829 stop:3533 length:705 start_codon:yes stop_codon:yes gene_type:complete
MKIFSDNINLSKSKFLRNLLDSLGATDENIALHLEGENIYLTNEKYREKQVVVNFSNSSLIKLTNERCRNNNDIFKKLFPFSYKKIIDCTAGFGRDGFILSNMGYNVTMIENSPVVSILLNHAVKTDNSKKIRFFHGNSYDFLANTQESFDYAYFDFMFQKTKTSSLGSKHDETLKKIAFFEKNIDDLISIATNKCGQRVVLKEAAHSNMRLPKPNYCIKTKLLNYNIYNGYKK